eukprot:3592697-Rhodomonas_salina.1
MTPRTPKPEGLLQPLSSRSPLSTQHTGEERQLGCCKSTLPHHMVHRPLRVQHFCLLPPGPDTGTRGPPLATEPKATSAYGREKTTSVPHTVHTQVLCTVSSTRCTVSLYPLWQALHLTDRSIEEEEEEKERNSEGAVSRRRKRRGKGTARVQRRAQQTQAPALQEARCARFWCSGIL